MRLLLFAAIIGMLLLAGCAAPFRQESGGTGAAPSLQEGQPSGGAPSAGQAAGAAGEKEVEEWLNSYDAELGQSAQDVASAG